MFGFLDGMFTSLGSLGEGERGKKVETTYSLGILTGQRRAQVRTTEKAFQQHKYSAFKKVLAFKH